MSKSVLVIDTPKSCKLCNLRTNCGQCEMCVAIEGYRIVTKYSEKGTKPEWCPLVPLPAYKEIIIRDSFESLLSCQFNQGYNSCLDEIEEKKMIKFWKEDFTYVKRLDCSIGGYIYKFSVRGESSNYLKNKYDLGYPNIYVNVFTKDNSMTVGSKNEKLQADIIDMEEEDANELLPLLEKEIEIDLRNYEEYLCDDGYSRDTRWG